MSKGKAGLFDALCDLSVETFVELRQGRDMGGPWLIVKYLNEDDEWESYTIEAERIN